MPQDHPDEPEPLVHGGRQTPGPNEPKGCFLGKGPEHQEPRRAATQFTPEVARTLVAAQRGAEWRYALTDPAGQLLLSAQP